MEGFADFFQRFDGFIDGFRGKFFTLSRGILSGKNGEGKFVTRQIRKAIDILAFYILAFVFMEGFADFFDNSTDLSKIFEVNFRLFQEKS